MESRWEMVKLYCEQGWYVFPCHGIDDGKCTCGDANCSNPGKHPIPSNGLHSATNDYKDFWNLTDFRSKKIEKFNIAIATGKKSGIIVIDVDGDISLLKDNSAPATVTSLTGKGTHLFYKYPQDTEKVKSCVGVLEHVDSRADGGYVIAPGSMHINKNEYIFKKNREPWNIALAEAPEWWIEKLKEKKYEKTELLTESEKIKPGSRNAYLARTIGLLWDKFGDYGIVEKIAHEINETKFTIPLDEKEVDTVIKSITRYTTNNTILQEIEENRETEQLYAPATISSKFPLESVSPKIDILVQDILNRSTKPQRELAIGATFSFLSTLIGSRFKSETGIYSNLYCVGVAGSGMGKDFARKYYKNLAFDMGQESILGGEEIASGQAIISAIREHPQHTKLYMLDEFGTMIESAAKSQQEYSKSKLTTFMKMYSSSGSVYMTADYADRKTNKSESIKNPFLSIYGTATPGQFFGACGSDFAKNGLLSRMIVAMPHNPRVKINRNADDSDNTKILDILKEFYNKLNPDQFSANLPRDTKKVMFTPDAKELFFDIDEMYLDKALKSEVAQSVYSRVAENACKIALIIAVFENPDNPIIDIKIMKKALDWAAWSAETILDGHEDHTAETPIAKASRDIEHAIKNEGLRGISRRALTQKSCWRKVQNYVAKEIIENLIESGIIVSTPVGKSCHYNWKGKDSS